MLRKWIAFYLILFSPLGFSNVRPTAVLTGGLAFVSGLESSTDFTQGLSQYDYDGTRNDATRGMFGGFLGAEFLLESNWLLQAGLAYYQFSNLPVEGTLIQGSSPQTSDEFDYEYEVNSYQVLFETKLLVKLQEFYPYISAGIGAAFNRSEQYTAFEESCDCAFTPIYEDQTHTSFSYNVGAGIDYDIFPYLRLGVGYRFTDLGDAKLGEGDIAGTEISQTLNGVDLQAQELILQLTYFTE